jgi:HK97 family phage portal protein
MSTNYRIETILDSGARNLVVPPTLINSYSTLSIPYYKRAVYFLTENLASFGRSVFLGKAEVDHPVDKLMKRPNGYQNSMQFFSTLFFHYAHYDSGFAEIKRDEFFNTVSLHNLMPDDIRRVRFSDEQGDIQQFYYQVSKQRFIPAANVIDLATIAYDGLNPYDPASLHEDSFQRAKTVVRYQNTYLQKGTFVRGWIGIPGEASDETKAQVQSEVRKFAGMDGNDPKDLMTLTGGATLNNATLTPQAAQLYEQEKQAAKAIGQIKNVPPPFLFEYEEAKYNELVEQMGEYVVRYVFRPIIECIESEMSFKLFTTEEQVQGYRVNINPNALLRGSTAEQEKIVIESVKGGIRKVNEGRELIGLPPDSDPKSDQLNILGDTRPVATDQATKQPTETPQTNASQPSPDAFAAIKPLLGAECGRVEARSQIAFDAAQKKTDQERVIWGNVFAEQQAGMIRQNFGAVATTLQTLTDKTLDVDVLATRYSDSIKRQAAGGEIETVEKILGDLLDGYRD